MATTTTATTTTATTSTTGVSSTTTAPVFSDEQLQFQLSCLAQWKLEQEREIARKIAAIEKKKQLLEQCQEILTLQLQPDSTPISSSQLKDCMVSAVESPENKVVNWDLFKNWPLVRARKLQYECNFKTNTLRYIEEPPSLIDIYIRFNACVGKGQFKTVFPAVIDGDVRTQCVVKFPISRDSGPPARGSVDGVMLDSLQVSKQGFSVGDDARAAFEKDIISQSFAIRYARRYKKALMKHKNLVAKQVSYSELLLLDLGSDVIALGEPFLNPQQWVKWNNNGNFVEKVKPCPTAQAFSHFTYVNSKEQLLICDIQGIETETDLKLSDPYVYLKSSLVWNQLPHGKRGPQEFLEWFSAHQCDALCDALGLTGHVPRE